MCRSLRRRRRNSSLPSVERALRGPFACLPTVPRRQMSRRDSLTSPAGELCDGERGVGLPLAGEARAREAAHSLGRSSELRRPLLSERESSYDHKQDRAQRNKKWGECESSLIFFRRTLSGAAAGGRPLIRPRLARRGVCP